jgi:hypothetical protein
MSDGRFVYNEPDFLSILIRNQCVCAMHKEMKPPLKKGGKRMYLDVGCYFFKQAS